MAVILYFFILISGSAFFAILREKDFERTLPITVFGIVDLLLLFGAAGHLLAGVYTIIGLAVLFYLYTVWQVFKNKKFYLLKAHLFNSRFVLFICFFVLISFANRGMHAYAWDEFTHWMTAVKVYLSADMLGPRVGDPILSVGYPPGTTLFEYFTARLFMLVGKLSVFPEWTAYLAVQILTLCPLFPLIDRKRLQGIPAIILTSCMVFLFPLFFYTDFYCTALTDSTLGILSGAGLATIFLTKTEDKDGFYHALIFMEIAQVYMTKRTGMVFAGFLALMYVADSILQLHAPIKQWINHKKEILCPLILSAAAVLIPRFIWKREVAMAPATALAQQKYLEAVAAGEVTTSSDGLIMRILKTFLSGDLGYRAQIAKDYVERFFDYTLPLGTTGIEISYILLFVVAVVLAYYIVHSANIEGCDKKHIGILISIPVLQMLAWLFFFLMAYMFAFQGDEATTITHYGRYIKAGFLALYVFLLFVLTDKWNKDEVQVTPKLNPAIILSLILLIICPIKEMIVFLGNQYPSQADVTWEPVKELCKEVDSLPTDSTLYFLSYEDDGKLWFQMNYYSRPRMVVQATFHPAAVDDGNRYVNVMQPEEWIDLLIEDNVDYVLLHSVDRQFIKDYSSVFQAEGDIHNNTIYKLENRKLTPCSQ